MAEKLTEQEWAAVTYFAERALLRDDNRVEPRREIKLLARALAEVQAERDEARKREIVPADCAVILRSGLQALSESFVAARTRAEQAEAALAKLQEERAKA